MFEFWYLPSIINAIDKIPKEVTIAATAYFLITDLHKRHTSVKIAEINANAKVAALEVEALKLKLEVQKLGPNINT